MVRRRYVITRVHAQFMEARGALGVWDPGEDRYTLHADVQYPHRVRNALATNIFKIPEHQIRVIAGDVGGAFGTKGWQYVEHRLVLWAARKLGRPVKWLCERREAILADEHARDNVTDAELALDAEGRFLALRVRTLANVGAYVSSDRNLLADLQQRGDPRRRLHASRPRTSRSRCMLTNTNSTAPYRGAGRPEATYVIERLIDDAARELGLDRLALRRANLIPAAAMPYKTALGVTYDCGEFEKCMDAALRLADVAGFPARREESKARGQLRGLAVVNAIEQAAGPQPEFAEIRFVAERQRHRLHGHQEPGPGPRDHVQAGPPRAARPRSRATCATSTATPTASRFGMGTMGSRSTVIGGTALWMAADKVIAKGRKIAAHLLEAAEADIGFADGTLLGGRHGPDASP